MPLRDVKHFVPSSRQAQSVYGMMNILLKNPAGPADNVSCISSFSDLRQAKKAVFRLPRGEKRFVSFKRTTHSSHPVVISVQGKAVFED